MTNYFKIVAILQKRGHKTKIEYAWIYVEYTFHISGKIMAFCLGHQIIVWACETMLQVFLWKTGRRTNVKWKKVVYLRERKQSCGKTSI